MDKTRCQKTMKNKGNLSTKLILPQNNKNALTTFLHSTDELFQTKLGKWKQCQGCLTTMQLLLNWIQPSSMPERNLVKYIFTERETWMDWEMTWRNIKTDFLILIQWAKMFKQIGLNLNQNCFIKWKSTSHRSRYHHGRMYPGWSNQLRDKSGKRKDSGRRLNVTAPKRTGRTSKKWEKVWRSAWRKHMRSMLKEYWTTA